MTPEPHRVPVDLLKAIAGGGGGRAALRQLGSAQRSKAMLMVRSVVATATANGHPEAAAGQAAYQALSDVAKAAPRSVAAVLSYPSVTAWALRTLWLLDAGEPAQARVGRLGAVAAAAAVRGRVPRPVALAPVTAEHRSIGLPSLGVATFSGFAPAPVRLSWGAGGAVLTSGRTTVPIPSDPYSTTDHWRGVRRITAECDGLALRLRLDDLVLDDLRALLGMGSGRWTPGTPAGTVREPREADRWSSRIADGWRLLACHHRAVAEEVTAGITVVAPLAPDGPGHRSGSFRHGFGCITMTWPPDPRSAALAFAHEIQHTKLSALMDLFPLSYQDDGERYYVPWRDDPRPLSGALHGAYAHLGVARFWRTQLRHEHGAERLRAQIEYARWRSAVGQVARTLAVSGRLTTVGRLLVDGMRDVVTEWQAESLPAAATAAARDLADRHYRRCQREPGPRR